MSDLLEYIGSDSKALCYSGWGDVVSISSDELTRMVSYENYGVFFSMSANKVELLGMYLPEFGPMEFAQKDGQEKSKTAKKAR